MSVIRDSGKEEANKMMETYEEEKKVGNKERGHHK